MSKIPPYAYFIIALPIAIGIYLTLNSQILGVDSWYWLKMTELKPMHFNGGMVLFWLSIFLLFYLAKPNLKNPFLIASFFLVNPFSIRFMMVELDDYLIFLISFIFLSAIASLSVKKQIKFNLMRLFSIAILLIYLYQHNFWLSADSLITETARNPILIVYLAPSLYLMFYNSYFIDLIITLAFYSFFPIGKFLTNALPIYIFAVHLMFLQDKKFKYSKKIMAIFLVLFVGFSWSATVDTIIENQAAFESYCDQQTKICWNTDPDSWKFGHYFAYKGYISANPKFWGVCRCKGIECLKKIIDCGI